MRDQVRRFVCLASLLLLIVDSRTAIASVQEGLDLCAASIIPSAFPFLLLINQLSPYLSGWNTKAFKWLSGLLRIPHGSESMFLIGLVSGYPVGAQNLNLAVRSGRLSPNDGARMLAFCANAGPAFIFGMGIVVLEKSDYCWLSWTIQIVSAILVGVITPGATHGHTFSASPSSETTVRRSIQEAWKAVAQICGWILLVRIGIGFLNKYLLGGLSKPVKALIYGTLELSNGICALSSIPSPGLRLCLFNALLAFGGICVAGQTSGVCDSVNMQMYIPGKITQAAITVLLCQLCQFLLPQNDRYFLPIPWSILIAAIPFIYPLITQKLRNKTSIRQCVAV